MAGKKYMSKKEYNDFVKKIQESNKKYGSKIKIDSKQAIALSKQNIRLPTIHFYAKDNTGKQIFNRLKNSQNNVVGTIERNQKIDVATYNLINAVNDRLADIQLPDKTNYMFTTFKIAVDEEYRDSQTGEIKIKPTEFRGTQEGRVALMNSLKQAVSQPRIQVDSEIDYIKTIRDKNTGEETQEPVYKRYNKAEFLYKRLLQNQEFNKNTRKGFSKISTQPAGLESDIKNNNTNVIRQLQQLAAPSSGINSVQQILDTQYMEYMDKINSVDPNMLTKDSVMSKEAQLGETLDKLMNYKDAHIRKIIQQNAKKDREEYIRFLYYAFGVTVSDRDRRKQKQSFIGLRRGDNTLVTKYAANPNLRKLIKTIEGLSYIQYYAAITQQSGIGRWELMDTVKQLLVDLKQKSDQNVDDQDQAYDFDVVEGRVRNQEEYDRLNNLFISMNNYFNRYQKYKYY